MPSILGAHSVNCKLKKKISKSKMKLSKLKTFSKSWLEKMMLTTLLLVVSGCGVFGKAQPALISDTYREKYYRLERDAEVEKALEITHPKIFRYSQINETTRACSCLDEKRRKQCEEKFLEDTPAH